MRAKWLPKKDPNARFRIENKSLNALRNSVHVHYPSHFLSMGEQDDLFRTLSRLFQETLVTYLTPATASRKFANLSNSRSRHCSRGLLPGEDQEGSTTPGSSDAVRGQAENCPASLSCGFREGKFNASHLTGSIFFFRQMIFLAQWENFPSVAAAERAEISVFLVPEPKMISFRGLLSTHWLRYQRDSTEIYHFMNFIFSQFPFIEILCCSF